MYTLTVNDFSNDDLGIHLEKKDPPPPKLDAPPAETADPLVLDPGGDGILTTGLASGIHFDHNGDGFKELSGFVNPEDGLLVLHQAMVRDQSGRLQELVERYAASDDSFLTNYYPLFSAQCSETFCNSSM